MPQWWANLSSEIRTAILSGIATSAFGLVGLLIMGLIREFYIRAIEKMEKTRANALKDAKDPSTPWPSETELMTMSGVPAWFGKRALKWEKRRTRYLV
jgi:hypothetical protein